MNIIFLTTLNPYDINNWSGTTYYVYNTLKKNHNVKVIGNNILPQIVCYCQRNFATRDSLYKYSPLIGTICKEQINHFPNCDLIFFGDLYLGRFLEVNIPIVHFSDVTYHSFKDYSGRKEDEETIRDTEMVEKNLLLNKYSTIIYSSEWAKQNTIDYYNVDPGKIHVVEFGANIPTPDNWQKNIQTDICNLVFIGRNWQKKGGEKILAAYRKLKSEEFPCTLTIIGSTPQVPYDEDDNLVVIPYLDKSQPGHLEKLTNIMKESHFLVLPTEFDAYGIVFCEASAYGVPSIAADVGGVSQPIRQGLNGYLLPPDATAEDYAKKIRTIFSDKESYLKLRASSRNEFETRLNWDVWSKKVNNILEKTVSNYKKKND